MWQSSFVGSSITTRGGDAKVHGRMPPVAQIELPELLLSASQAGPETFDLAGPALRLRFGDSGDRVVADLAELRESLRKGPRGSRVDNLIEHYLDDKEAEGLDSFRIEGAW